MRPHGRPVTGSTTVPYWMTSTYDSLRAHGQLDEKPAKKKAKKPTKDNNANHHPNHTQDNQTRP